MATERYETDGINKVIDFLRHMGELNINDGG